jgi:hypothetical protein
MSGGPSVDVRNCTECGQARASVTKQEQGQTQVYYQCLMCDPGWSRAGPATLLHPVRP